MSCKNLSRGLLRFVASLFFVVFMPLIVNAANVPNQPFLRINPGFHNAMINAIVVDKDGIFTVSDDKTLRRFDKETLKPLSVMYPPVGTGDEGALYRVAVSGKLIAAAGQTGLQWDKAASVYFFSKRKNKLIGRLSSLPASVTALAFSPDDRFLAVGLGAGKGLRIYDMAKMTPVVKDTAFNGSVIGLSYDSAGRLAVLSEGGTYALFDNTPVAIVHKTIADIPNPWGLALSPDGSKVAIGSRTQAIVGVFVPATLDLHKKQPTHEIKSGGFSALAFSPDGHILAAAGTAKAQNNLYAITLLKGADMKAGKISNVSIDTITGLAFLAGDKIVASSALPSLSIYHTSGKKLKKTTAAKPDFRNGQQKLKLSENGQVVAYGTLKDGPDIYTFDVTNRRFTGNPIGLRPPVTIMGAHAVPSCRNTSKPQAFGRTIALETGDTARACAFDTNRETLVLGTDFALYGLDENGTHFKTILSSPAWAVNVSQDGTKIVATLGDGTIRWFNPSTGQELVALFAPTDDPRSWVMWTPDGFFDHAAGFADRVGDFIGYQLNNGADKNPVFLPVTSLYNAFYRRDMVSGALRNTPEDIRERKRLLNTIGNVRNLLANNRPPNITLKAICPKQGLKPTDCITPRKTVQVRGAKAKPETITVNTPSVNLTFEATPHNNKMGDIIVRRNSVGIGKQKPKSRAASGKPVIDVMVPLNEGPNELTVTAYSTDNHVEMDTSEQIHLSIMRSTAGENALKNDETTLYILSFGVSDYAVDSFDLDNAARDAKAIAKIMENGTGNIYHKTETHLLTDKQATRKNILDTFDTVAKKAKTGDMVLLFIAGHGLTVDNGYSFAPYEIAANDQKLLSLLYSGTDDEADEAIHAMFRQYGLSQNLLIQRLRQIAALRMVVLLDTCHSGALATLNATVRNERRDSWVTSMGKMAGRFILAGSSADQQALDAAQDNAGTGQGHGLFTTWLLKALEGQADMDNDKQINIYELASFTRKGVTKESQAMNYRQVPSMSLSVTDFFAVRDLD